MTSLPYDTCINRPTGEKSVCSTRTYLIISAYRSPSYKVVKRSDNLY